MLEVCEFVPKWIVKIILQYFYENINENFRI